MFQLLLKARARKRATNHRAEKPFVARSAKRDTETDHTRIDAIISAIDIAIREGEREKAGLSRRVDDALARAAVTIGNATDEYLERESLDNYHQNLFAAEISNGQRRLNELESTISHLNFIKVTVLTRFPVSRLTLPLN